MSEAFTPRTDFSFLMPLGDEDYTHIDPVDLSNILRVDPETICAYIHEFWRMGKEHELEQVGKMVRVQEQLGGGVGIPTPDVYEVYQQAIFGIALVLRQENVCASERDLAEYVCASATPFLYGYEEPEYADDVPLLVFADAVSLAHDVEDELYGE